MIRHAAVTVTAFMTLLGAACSGEQQTGRTVVASFYPLAFVADRVAGPGWEVIDLTPPGTEAHDVDLSIEARAAIEAADIVLYLGDYGFQPQVEAAVKDASRHVVVVGDFVGADLAADPHIWLDPGHMIRITEVVARSIAGASGGSLRAELEELSNRYREGLASCRFRTLIVPHEAFGYLAEAYRLKQFGLSGVNPEGEPTAARLSRVLELIASGRAGAVFYEVGGASQGVAETVARDAGVAALPLSTLESQPEDGDYLSVMEQNLEYLRRGLGCP